MFLSFTQQVLTKHNFETYGPFFFLAYVIAIVLFYQTTKAEEEEEDDDDEKDEEEEKKEKEKEKEDKKSPPPQKPYETVVDEMKDVLVKIASAYGPEKLVFFAIEFVALVFIFTVIHGGPGARALGNYFYTAVAALSFLFFLPITSQLISGQAFSETVDPFAKLCVFVFTCFLLGGLFLSFLLIQEHESQLKKKLQKQETRSSVGSKRERNTKSLFDTVLLVLVVSLFLCNFVFMYPGCEFGAGTVRIFTVAVICVVTAYIWTLFRCAYILKRGLQSQWNT